MSSDDKTIPTGPTPDPPENTSAVSAPMASTLPSTAFSLVLDRIVCAIGRLASWLWIAVVGLILWAVVSRYAFNSTSIALDEMQWHLVGTAWLLGLAYTLVLDEHVRVDVFHEGFSLRRKAWVELLGLVFLLVPFLAVAVYETVPFAADSFRTGERSVAPGGLGHLWTVKAAMALAFVLLLVAALSRLTRVTALLFGIPRALSSVSGR